MHTQIIDLDLNLKSYDQKNIFKDAHISVYKNDFLLLIGESGSGKSTLLNIIALLDQHYKGNYQLFNELITHKSSDELAQLRSKYFGYIFQMFYLLDDYTVAQNIELSNRYAHKHMQRDEIDNIMDQLNISHLKHSKASILSGGEKQRTAFARAVLNNPQIIIADEPTGNLDPLNTTIIMDYLKQRHHLGATIIMVSHDKSLAQYATRVMEIKHGKIIEL